MSPKWITGQHYFCSLWSIGGIVIYRHSMSRISPCCNFGIVEPVTLLCYPFCHSYILAATHPIRIGFLESLSRKLPLYRQADKHNRVTLRQTQILVIPTNEDLNQSFIVFDTVINAINQARKAARELVTDHSLEKLDDQLYGEDEDRDWV